MWFLLLPVNVVSTKLISSHKISANAIATNLVSTNGVSIIMVSANTIFNLIFNLYDLEVDWIGHRELKFLRELQISPWPIAPSNFSPLCLIIQKDHSCFDCKVEAVRTALNFSYSKIIWRHSKGFPSHL